MIAPEKALLSCPFCAESMGAKSCSNEDCDFICQYSGTFEYYVSSINAFINYDPINQVITVIKLSTRPYVLYENIAKFSCLNMDKFVAFCRDKKKLEMIMVFN